MVKTQQEHLQNELPNLFIMIVTFHKKELYKNFKVVIFGI